jgi:hypothetical protein
LDKSAKTFFHPKPDTFPQLPILPRLAEAPIFRARRYVMGKFTLRPYHVSEGLRVRQAAVVAGKSERTIRDWCARHGIGRRVAGGTLIVSKVALLALLDGDDDALVSYRDHGVRGSYPAVAKFYERANLRDLLALPEFMV